MIYTVEISDQAEKDLRGIYEYISFVLLSTNNAEKNLHQLYTAISKLDYMPERYRKYEKEPWYSRAYELQLNSHTNFLHDNISNYSLKP